MAEKNDVYTKAETYWSNVASDVDGMLGGFEQLHAPDINASRQFLMDMRKRVSRLKDSFLLTFLHLESFTGIWHGLGLWIGHWPNHKTSAIASI
jgi:hypothetical protein